MKKPYQGEARAVDRAMCAVDRVPLFGLLGRTAERLRFPRRLEAPRMATSGTRAARVDWRTRWAAPPRTSYTTETKPFFLTSEFLVFVLFLMGLAVGSATQADRG